MMKNFMFLILGLVCLVARAIPADPTPVKVTQPDGTTLTVVLHGDEFFHFTTTLDGYTVLKNEAGYYTYARLDGNRLASSGIVAHDKGQRTATDLAALASIPKGLNDRSAAQAGTLMLNRRNAAMRRVGADGHMDYERFRGLIILINYTNKKFTMSNPSSFYDDMVNTPNFTGYTLNNRFVSMTGSVRDYFYDNSNHMFDPVFDVVGPVEVNYTCTYPQGTNNSDAVFNAALQAVDSQIDFNDYDSDGDGEVDMVFFLVAGFSANYTGNNENYLWPHMYYLYWSPPLDGVSFGLYACSTEIAGWEGYYSDVNGIGTICHEFGHVLGLPDLYDTDYSGSGGESRNPGEWSVMAAGSSRNFGRNPVGYSLYERYALGFNTPTVINKAGSYQLQPLDESNVGYRLNTPNDKEFFLIENRQPGKWDRNLPGHGMMVARVDSTDERIWWSNQVNCNPNRMYYELLRASYVGEDGPSDPFPGTYGITSITNFTDPNLHTWDGNFNDFSILDIAERNNIITFNVEADTSILAVIEDFEGMPVTDNLNMKGVQGVFAKWDFVKCSVQEYDGAGEGTHAVAMKKPSQFTTTTTIQEVPYMISFTVHNPTSTTAHVRMTYSVDNGTTWLSPTDGTVTASANSSASVNLRLPMDAPLMLRFTQTAGSDKKSIYLDNIKLNYKDKWPPVAIPGDVNGDGEVNISDINAAIQVILQGDQAADNPFLATADVNGDGEVNISDVNAIISLILHVE